MKTRSMVFVCVALLFAMTISYAQTATSTTPADTATPVVLPSVQAGFANLGSVIKIDGRIFTGIINSQAQGAYPHASLAIPDAKLRFTYMPSKDVTVVSRLKFITTSPSSMGFDYLYADLNNWAGLIPGHTLRVGRMKIDFGEETWTDNQVESNLVSNSVAVPNGYDEGLDFRGPICKGDHPVSYSLSLLNGTKDLSPAVGAPACVVKLGASPMKHLYLSGSYLNTGKLGVNSTDFAVAGITSMPGGATNWQRHAWEADARWNFGPTGQQNFIPTGPTAAVPFVLAAAFGQLADDPTGAAKRDGNYWYAEGLYNITKKIYASARFSDLNLLSGATAKIADSPVAVNKYQRTSLSLGYRLSALTAIKAEYSINKTDGASPEPKLNQFALGVATKF